MLATGLMILMPASTNRPLAVARRNPEPSALPVMIPVALPTVNTVGADDEYVTGRPSLISCPAASSRVTRKVFVAAVRPTKNESTCGVMRMDPMAIAGTGSVHAARPKPREVARSAQAPRCSAEANRRDTADCGDRAKWKKFIRRKIW